jgi:hypothetical protein
MRKPQLIKVREGASFAKATACQGGRLRQHASRVRSPDFEGMRTGDSPEIIGGVRWRQDRGPGCAEATPKVFASGRRGMQETKQRRRVSHRFTQIFTDVQKDSENQSVFHLCSSVAKDLRYRVGCSCEGPAGAFFFSAAAMPIFFRNGSTDCLRPRNFSIETVTSRESPCS